LQEIGQIYQILGDESKNLEYMKQAYGIRLALFDENHDKTKSTKSKIELLQPNFFANQVQILKEQDYLGGNKVGSEYRWIVTSRGESTNNLITLKQKIQKDVLNNVVESVDNYGWTNAGWLYSDWGVKGYLEESYLKKALEELGSENENIETAQMLCFESMNLGIMKSAKKPYFVMQEFTRNNPELIKKIAKQHPEFFVDGSIVEACVRAMPDDDIFQRHIFEHVKYMGMEERKAQKEAA